MKNNLSSFKGCNENNGLNNIVSSTTVLHNKSFSLNLE